MRNNSEATIPTRLDDDIYGDCDSDTFEWDFLDFISFHHVCNLLFL